MRRSAAILVASAVVAACGGGDSGTAGEDPATSVVQEPSAPEPAAVDVLEDPARLEGRIVLGRSFDVDLVIETCVRGLPDPVDDTAPSELVVVQATGARDDGTPVVVDVRRFRTVGAATTITDTVTVIEGPETTPERVLQAQRFEVGGLVTDARDPDAQEPLLRLRRDGITGEGVFGPPGTIADAPGLVEGRFALGCPG